MKLREFYHILAAIILFTIIGSIEFVVELKWFMIPRIFLFSTIIIFLVIFAKKLVSSWLDADVEHELWVFARYGIKESWHLEKPIPAGIIFPLITSIFTLGWIKFSTFLTYEARALKRRAAKRFGVFSYSELTEFHNSLIGVAGITTCFIIAIIAYFSSPALEPLAKLSVFYALSNMIPIPKFDGAQIFLGSRVIYAILGIVALIFSFYAWTI